jgi:hypothetical protein
MLNRALQRNAKHEARLSNIFGHYLKVAAEKTFDIESLASRTSSAALQLHFAQSDMLDDR